MAKGLGGLRGRSRLVLTTHGSVSSGSPPKPSEVLSLHARGPGKFTVPWQPHAGRGAPPLLGSRLLSRSRRGVSASAPLKNRDAPTPCGWGVFLRALGECSILEKLLPLGLLPPPPGGATCVGVTLGASAGSRLLHSRAPWTPRGVACRHIKDCVSIGNIAFDFCDTR